MALLLKVYHVAPEARLLKLLLSVLALVNNHIFYWNDCCWEIDLSFFLAKDSDVLLKIKIFTRSLCFNPKDFVQTEIQN